MPIPERYKAPFCPDIPYHMLFRSIDGLLLFQQHADYLIFLKQFAEYFQPIAHTLAYNLLQNHTHFIVQVKNRETILENLCAISKRDRTHAMEKLLIDPANDSLVDELFQRQVNSFMTSFVKLRNNESGRKGGLFQSPFRRSYITNEAHLHQSIIYVHANAKKHGLVEDFRQHRYSSYQEILSGNSTNISVQKVLDIFGGTKQFIELHDMQVEHFYK